MTTIEQPFSSSPVVTPLVPIQSSRLDSTDLLQGEKTVEIDHAGQRYLLRVTRENKLILTK